MLNRDVGFISLPVILTILCSYGFSPIGVEDYDEGSGEDEDGDEVVVFHKAENGKPDAVELGNYIYLHVIVYNTYALIV